MMEPSASGVPPMPSWRVAPVDEVGDDVLRDLDVLGRGLLGLDGGRRAVLALDDHGDVGDVDGLVVCAVDLRQLVVDLDDYGVRAAYHVQRRAGGEGEVEIAVLVHRRGADIGHVDVQEFSMIPGQVAEDHGGEVGLTLVEQLALVAGAVPGVVAEVLAAGVALGDLDGAVHDLAAELDVKELVAPLRQGLVALHGEGGAVAVFDPVAALDELSSILGRAELGFVFAYEVHISSSVC